jgi:tetratricopeptide (TPR) repeat protein
MDKDPQRRYQTAGQMAEDLRRYVNRFAILARRVGPVARLRKWVKRNPALSAALAALLLCVIGAGALAYLAHRAERQRVEDQAKHDEELLQEKRRSALDKAILAARLEDFDGAREAIREAESLGCSAGQIHMLQGQLELFQGRGMQAIDHLSRATELLPDSVAAWSMLSVADIESGRATDSYRALSEATRLPAVTPEDFLFRGLAEAQLDPERGLSTLDEALRRRPSVLARLVHTEALRMRLLDVPDVEKAREAMDAARVLKGQLPETARVLSLTAMVHLGCYQVFDEFQQSELRRAALEEGMKDARALERYPDSSRGMLARWVFLRDTGQGAAGLAELRRWCNESRKADACYPYGQWLYRQGEFEQAVATFELAPGETIVDSCRVMALAELPDGLDRANRLYREMTARDLDGWDLFNSQLILRFLGRKDEAIEVSRKFLAQPTHFPPVRQEPFRRALEYCAGQRSAEDLIASMHGIRGDLSNAYLCIALTALADGDRPLAKKHLQLCVQTRHFEFYPYDLAQMLLSRMDKDPQWPPWIKTAK